MRSEPLEHGLKNRILVGGGVDHEMPIGCSLGLGEITLPDPTVKCRPLQLHAVELRGKSPRCSGLIDIEDHHQIRFATPRRDSSHRHDFLGIKPPGSALVGQGRRDEAIRKYESTFCKCGADSLIHQLGSAGHVEQHLASKIHLFVSRVEQHTPDRLTDRRPSRLPDFDRNHAVAVTETRELRQLRRLSRSIRTIEDNESAGQNSGPVMHRRQI